MLLDVVNLWITLVISSLDNRSNSVDNRSNSVDNRSNSGPFSLPILVVYKTGFIPAPNRF